MLGKNLNDLTNSQKSIWVTEQYYKGTSVNNICGTAIIYEKVDFLILEKAIKIVCQKHDNFKTKLKIKEDNIRQTFEEPLNSEIQMIKVDSKEELEKRREEIVRKPFDVNQHLFKFYIFKFSNDYGAFMLNIHHLISDAWTLALICNEIIKTYSAIKQNKEVETKAIYSYIDYINSEKEYQQSEKYQKDKKYWLEKYQTIPEVARIPGSKYENDKITNIKGERTQFSVKKDEINKIKEYCKENKISLYNFFMAVFAIYIAEISNLDDFVIGTPILNRTNFKEKNCAGMFINVAPLRINFKEDIEFKEFVKNIAIDSMNMLKHQKYSYQSLLEEIRKKDINIPNLYNILLSYQITNTQMSGGDIKYKTEWTFNGCSANDLDIQIYDINDTGNLNIAYDYKKSIYTKKDIENLHSRILYIIKQIIEQNNINMQDIEIITPEEKEKILNEFNNTEAKYDENALIIKYFEEQVVKEPNKIALISNGNKITYEELNKKANMLAKYIVNRGIKKDDVIGIMVNRSPEMIIGLIAILKCGATYLPIDSEYPIDRISYMIENSETKTVLVNNKTEKLIPQNCSKINIELKNTEIYKETNIQNIDIDIEPNTLAYLIYTSGSTGKPKGVKITHRNLNNFIIGMKKIIDFNPNKVMVSVTTISFDIFGLEIWCSLSSGQTLVLANEEEQNTPSLLNKLCMENKVNIIQTTPSRYSTIFENPNNLGFLKNISEILVGGEAINNKLLQNMKKFSNARIFNMYGPTETTIWSTVKELTNEKKITIGKPIANTQCYILNKNHKVLPTNIAGELYIGGDGLSKGYLKRDDLNAEKFIRSPLKKHEKIYNTNDLAYFKDNGEIVHLGRTDYQVKIRGFRVELGEIENIIEKEKSITQCVVVKKKLLNGHDALIAYYTTNQENDDNNLENRLREELNKELPQYMVPQYIIKLSQMPYTPNGKIDRKSLPEPHIKNERKEIIKPRNELDKELIKILSKMLRVENISIEDSLLELGGDSLTAITLSTKILSKYDVQVSIKDILTKYKIKDISDYISENKSKGNEKIKIKKAPIQELYPLSTAQKRIYYNSKMIGEENIVYNLSGAILVEDILDKNKVKEIFEKIIERHEILRTSFVVKEGELFQKVEDKFDFEIPIYNDKNEDIQEIVDNFSKPFNLEKAPLIRVELHYIDNAKTLLLLETHHIVMDGTGLNNLIIEFNRLYNGANLKKIPIQYKDYAVWENEYIKSKNIEKYEQYWLNKFKDIELSQLNLPYDYKLPTNRSYKGAKVSNMMQEADFMKIERDAKKIGVSPYMFFITTFLILLYKYTGQNDITIGSPIANRNINETKRMIGMFGNNIVVRGKINSDSTFIDFLNEIKNQILDDLSNQPYPFDMLVKKLNIKNNSSNNPLFDIMFTYQNKEENIIEIGEKHSQIIELDNNISKFNLSIEVKPKTHTINIEYCTDLFKEDTIKRLFIHYMNTIKSVVEDKEIKIKDISIISQEEKNKILYEFNNTKTEYPRDKTVAQLFEEQAQKTPDNIAVVFDDKKLTYRELNEKANQLADYILKQDIHSGDVIPLLLDKSLESIVAIIAILKIGCAYLPIDIGYPKERIEYILKDSKAKILLTSRNLNLETRLLIKTIYIDLDTENIYSSSAKQNINYKGNTSDLAYIMYTSGSTGKPKGVMIENKNIVRLVKNTNYIEFKKDDKILQTGSIVFDACTFEIWGALLNGLELYIIKKEELLDAEKLHTYIIKNKISVLWLTAPLFNQLTEDNPHMFRTVRCVLTGGDVLSCKHINMVKSANPKLILINGYGPTENTTFSCCFKIDKQYKNSIPIGKPIANSTCYIMSKDEKLQPIGIPGELWVGGDGVGRGYLNNPDLTKEKFIDNPFNDGKAYKTGDLAKWNEDGTVEFMGRIDSQIKIRGFRVELSEITTVVSLYDGIKEAYTIYKDIKNEKAICTYIVSKEKIDTEKLKTYMAKFLPQYMIPKYIIQLKSLPKNQNGKIDKNALPEIKQSVKNEKTIIKPTSPTEEKIVEMFKSVLDLEEISTDDNFFERGGDSISAMRLQIEALRNNINITYGDIFKYPTVKQMADFVENDIEAQQKNIVDDIHKYDNIINKNIVENLAGKNIQFTPIGDVLLTGVTGFLGVHVLDSYLKQEKGTIYCLIRNKNHISSIDRLRNVLHFYFKDKYDKYVGNRIRCIEGDITQENLGLTEKEYNELGKSITTLIHSAALVKHFGNYKEFEEINVKGTKRIVEFCKKFDIRLMHISTISVSGNNFAEGAYIENNIKEDIYYGENNFYVGQNLENLYVRSKFLAEKEVLKGISEGLNAYILRMGNLTSRYSEGKFQQNHLENAFVGRIKTFLQIGCIPDYMTKGYVEFTPIDYSGDAIIKLANHYDKKFSIFHILNYKHLKLTEFYDILQKLGVNVKIVSPDEFLKIVDELLKDKEKSNILQGIIRDFDSNRKLIYESNIKITENFTKDFLKKLDFEWPEIDINYIRKYLDYLIGIGYLNIKLKED